MLCASKVLPVAWTALVAFVLVGCGDLTSGVGDQGRLEFSLATNYDVSGDLSDVKLIAGHPQSMNVDTTSRGDDDIAQPEEITYRFDPDDGVEVELEHAPVGAAPDFVVTAKKAGTYKLRAIYKGKEVDSLTLRFGVPKTLELAVKVRKPSGKDFDAVPSDDITDVDEGAQALFVPIPKDSRGERLVGTLITHASASAPELVVPGQSLIEAYEDGVWTVNGNLDFYFIDPGAVTITVRDDVNKAEGKHTFRVQNVGGE